MSDQAPDPMDKTYAEAEALLDDAAARAARRSRVLGAVAQAGGTEAAPVAAKRRMGWRHGRWLAAASVAGLSLLVAVQLEPPSGPRPAAPAQAPKVARPPVPAAPVLERRSAPVDAHAAAPPATQAPAGRAEARARDPVPESAPSPPPPVQAAPTPAPQPASPAADRVQELVVTARRAEPEARAPSAAMKGAPAPASPATAGERLRAAAAAGRIVELRSLLAEGTSVDAADDDGETALMRAVQGHHAAAAGLLRRRGASLDLANRAGVSARDMAASVDDPELNRALGLAP